MNNRLLTSKTYLASFFIILALFITTISPGTVSAQPGESASAVSLAAAPIINVWHGLNQTFGSVGLPQRQINILGNVSDSDGVASLTYTLNGGSPKPLSRGPDGRRLLMAGDFNVELFDVELKHGANQVVITATDTLAEVATATVTVTYNRDKVWPLPFTTNWAAGINSQSQVIDGDWAVQGNGVRTMQIGYDRLVGIGDIGWKDYEVTVPITINSFDAGATCDVAPGYCPGIGLIMRWTGNTDSPVAGMQPKEGWWPLGAIGWVRWVDAATAKLQILGNLDANLVSTPWTVPVAGQTYNYKMRVTTTGSGPQYQLKVWQGAVEPASWTLTGTGNLVDPASGSLVLIAHKVDATFGNVTVTRLGSAPVPSTIQSDDFRTGSLNTGIWSFVNPVGDGSYSFTGANTPDAWLNISMPAGSDHDLLVSNNKAPRVMQNANNTNFDVETKFELRLDSHVPDARHCC